MTFRVMSKVSVLAIDDLMTKSFKALIMRTFCKAIFFLTSFMSTLKNIKQIPWPWPMAFDHTSKMYVFMFFSHMSRSKSSKVSSNVTEDSRQRCYICFKTRWFCSLVIINRINFNVFNWIAWKCSMK